MLLSRFTTQTVYLALLCFVCVPHQTKTMMIMMRLFPSGNFAHTLAKTVAIHAAESLDRRELLTFFKKVFRLSFHLWKKEGGARKLIGDGDLFCSSSLPFFVCLFVGKYSTLCQLERLFTPFLLSIPYESSHFSLKMLFFSRWFFRNF